MESKTRYTAIRVNARLTGDDARRFKELQDREKWSPTDVIRETVREYHGRSSKPRKSAWQLMSESGLVGCMKDAPSDLSTNKRKYLAEYFAGKAGRRKKRGRK